ncbi:glycoside hydrolase family 15 protein [Oceanidesulfovibrio marinus]|uniref:glycoside hydrolase family 15 protein n=1 Tax=Oceanidesulfovibrio marinus TaxID=370038 RepID=UPI001C0F0876|nr:glycoside hydrolase family 15 protein [Oceanidesulfovibrio marinus]
MGSEAGMWALQKEYLDLEEYGIVGNLETCALIGRNGSVDWMCLPWFESPSVFGALLDPGRGGRFLVTPEEKFHSFHGYISHTNILETTFRTIQGQMVIQDFMPVVGQSKQAVLYRKLHCTWGSIRMYGLFAPAPAYGSETPEYEKTEHGIRASHGDLALQLVTSLDFQIGEEGAASRFVLQEGQSAWLVLAHGDMDFDTSNAANEAAMERTRRWWNNWLEQCGGKRACAFEDDVWGHVVTRSELALKLLTNPRTGAVAAAATTSLPEALGGERNWDYRFSWVRDSSFLLQALFHLGHHQEAMNYIRWIDEKIAKEDSARTLQVLYSLHGEDGAEERTLSELRGYRDAKPVRIGNGASEQFQLDIFGELTNMIYQTTRYGRNLSGAQWRYTRDIVNMAAEVWQEKDQGIWEMRGEPRHNVYSKVMCWVALDRGVRMAESNGFDAPLEAWRATRDAIHNAVLERGFNKQRNSFVDVFDGEELDAANLLIPVLGFLPGDDPRVLGTIDAALEHLSAGDGLLFRYTIDDGLRGKEGAFAVCSFWMVKALVLAGRNDEAEQFFLHTLDYISPLGLLSEEVNPASSAMLGNFPQAFSHIGLINCALYLGLMRGKDSGQPRPMGME